MGDWYFDYLRETLLLIKIIHRPENSHYTQVTKRIKGCNVIELHTGGFTLPSPTTPKRKVRKRKPANAESHEQQARGLDPEVLQELKELFTQGALPTAKRRDSIVMTRVFDSDLRIVDALISLDIFKSRSEAVAFLVHEGILAKRELVDTILPAIDQIEEIKRRARKEAVKAIHRSTREKQD